MPRIVCCTFRSAVHHICRQKLSVLERARMMDTQLTRGVWACVSSQWYAGFPISKCGSNRWPFCKVLWQVRMSGHSPLQDLQDFEWIFERCLPSFASQSCGSNRKPIEVCDMQDHAWMHATNAPRLRQWGRADNDASSWKGVMGVCTIPPDHQKM